MPLDRVFSAAGQVALIGWLLLIFLPRWRYTRIVASIAVPVLLAICYVVLLLTHTGSPGGFGSLTQVRLLFDTPAVLLAGWIHYLAFDLFIGSWIVGDSQRAGLPHLLVVPCLVVTFLFGPAGLLLYYTLRTARRFTQRTPA